MQAYSEDSDEVFVACDECELWIHAKCDGITKEKLQELEQKDSQYFCPICRKKRAQKQKK